MPDYFDCMRCGHMSLVTAKPPKCPKCGSGAGVIVTRPDSPAGPPHEGAPATPPKESDPPKQ